MARVLVVDDALFMRKMIRDALEPAGFEIAGEASNGQEGFDQFEALRPDLITLDIIMPEVDGLACLKRIREIDPDARVIMITAVDQRESMLEAMKIGVSDFIVKPFEEARVVSAVHKALSHDSQETT